MIILGEDERFTWRANAKPYRAAMSKALSRVVINGEDALTLVNSMILQDTTAVEIKISWLEVIQFERLHPDVRLWTSIILYGLDIDIDMFLDALFELALNIENGLEDKADASLIKIQEMLNA